MMLYDIFNSAQSILLEVVNMSITASWLILAVLALRLVFKKAPKWINCVLWAMAALRLVAPFSFESPLSLIPKANTVTPSVVGSVPNIAAGSAVTGTVPPASQAVSEALGSATSAVSSPAAPVATEVTASTASVSVFGVLSVIWVVGIVAMLAYATISYVKLRKNVRASVRLEKNIYICDGIASPFILGIFRPKIYLPSNIAESEREFIVSHEKAHLRRFDHIWKPLGFLILSVHWFNPLCWLAYTLLCKDIELACDEKVIKEYSIENKKRYSQTLLDCSVNRRRIAACPLAFGETGVKERIKSVLSYKKPTVWVIAVSLVVCAVTSVCLMTDPKSKEVTLAGYVYTCEEVCYTDKSKSEKKLEKYKYAVSWNHSIYADIKGTGNWECINTLDEKEFDEETLRLIDEKMPKGYSVAKLKKLYSAETAHGLSCVAVSEKGDIFFVDIAYNEKSDSLFVTFVLKLRQSEKLEEAESIPYEIKFELLTDSVPYSENWQEETLPKLIYAGKLTVLDEKEFSSDSNRKAYVLAFETDDAYKEKYLAVETNEKVLFKSIGGSYEAELHTADLDGDGNDEILLRQLVDIAGGAGNHIAYIFEIRGDRIETFYDSFIYGYDTGFSGKLEKGKALTIKNKYTGLVEYADFGKDREEGELSVDSFCEFYPLDVDGDGVYEICTEQYTSLSFHSNYAGTAKCVLKYDREKKFKVIDAQFIPCYMSDT